MDVRFLMPNFLGEDIEFRERLVEHLIAYSEMFNGIESHSIVSASILLYGTPERNPKKEYNKKHTNTSLDRIIYVRHN